MTYREFKTCCWLLVLALLCILLLIAMGPLHYG